jgi:FMN phosphatase YigB (HAD superfamily)
MDFDADNTLTDTGVWRDYQDAKFLIAHISNMKFQRALARYQQPHRRALENGSIDPQVNRDILCKAMAEGIVLGWQGVTSRATKAEEPFSPKAALTLLKNDAEFRDFVTEVAAQISNYRREEAEELGNS